MCGTQLMVSCNFARVLTYVGALLPGYPQDTSPAGTSSPLYGLNAASDPVMASAPSGQFYLGGLAFDRDGISRIFVARYTDRNNTEGGEDIFYDFTKIIDSGSTSSNGAFADKPAIASDVPRAPGVCGNVYMSYTMFDGLQANGRVRSKLLVARSTDCGVTWSRPFKVNMPYIRNQGSAIAVDPRNGWVYIIWRDFYENNMLLVKSTDGGRSFSRPLQINGATPIQQFDQPTLDTPNNTFRSNGFPTMTVDGDGRVHVAWQERVDSFGVPSAMGSPRIMLTTSIDGGAHWTPRGAVDNANGAGPQVMPALSASRKKSSASASQLMLLYYDGRASGGLDPATNFISGIERQVDVRVVEADSFDAATGRPTFGPSVQVSQYSISAANGNIVETVPGYPAVNRPNLPIYRGGTAPFLGDYNYLVPAVQFVRTETGWRWATDYNVPVAKIPDTPHIGVWTDNRDIFFPGTPANINGDYTQYAPPGTGQPSCINPGSRNANIYSSEITPGVVAGSPATFKSLGTIQRAFVVYVENPNGGSNSGFFRLSMADDEANGVDGSFQQLSNVNTLDVEILPHSSITRTVYVTSANQTASVRVDVNQISGIGGTLISGGRSTSIALNSDPTNPQLSNPQLSNTELHNPQLSNPQLSNPQLSNPQLSNPQLSNPQISNPQLSNPQLSNTAFTDGATVYKTTDMTWTVKNAGNTTSAYSALTNVANYDALRNSYRFQLIIYRTYLTPAANNCDTIQTPQDEVISNIPNPQLSNPQLSNATFFAAPSDAAPTTTNAAMTMATLATTATGGQDGTTQAPRLKEEIKITLRAFQIVQHPPVTFDPNLVTQGVSAQAANIVNGIIDPMPPAAFYAPDLIVSSGTPTATPSTIVAGGTVQLSAWTIKNQGTADTHTASGIIENGFYLSTDPTITPGDVRLDGNQNTDSVLKAGEQFNWGAPTLTIPANTPPGNYYIGILVDETNHATESNETNNFVSVPIIVTAAAPPASNTVIDFETYPNGTPACSNCPLTNEYASRGVVFSFTSNITPFTNAQLFNSSGYDPVGGTLNHSVTSAATPNGGFYSGTVTMALAPSTANTIGPNKVTFRLRGNDSIPVFPVTAYDANGVPLSPSTITRTNVSTYTSGGGFTFREETVTITSLSEISRVDVDMNGFIVLIDNLQLQQVYF